MQVVHVGDHGFSLFQLFFSLLQVEIQVDICHQKLIKSLLVFLQSEFDCSITRLGAQCNPTHGYIHLFKLLQKVTVIDDNMKFVLINSKLPTKQLSTSSAIM